MALWKLFEASPKAPVVVVRKAALPVPTIVVTPVLEEREEYLELGYKVAEDSSTSPQTHKVKSPVVDVVVEVLPTPPTWACDDEDAKGLGISGIPTTPPYGDPLNEVDDLLEILGLDNEAERDAVEDEVERMLEALDANASKLVNKSKLQFLELSREWNDIVEREYLPAKREAKMVISESYAMEQFKKRDGNSSERTQKLKDDQLFASIVLADAARPACLAAVAAAEKIHNLQHMALTKYATRLKDHKILPLASYRRYVRRVKRTEREMEGWRAKVTACRKILVLGEKVLNEMVEAEAETEEKEVRSSADSGYGE